MLSRALTLVLITAILSAPFAQAAGPLVTPQETQAIQESADDFWENYVRITKLLPESAEQISENASSYRDNALVPVKQDLQNVALVFERVTDIALHDQRAMTEDEKAQIRAEVQAKAHFRNKTKHYLAISGTMGIGLGVLIGSSLAPIFSVFGILGATGLGIMTILRATGKAEEVFTPSNKTIDSKFEALMQKRFKASWEIFFKHLELNYGLKLKGLTFNARFKNFQKWMRKSFKINELQALCLLPSSACEALLLPNRSSTLLLPAGTSEE